MSIWVDVAFDHAAARAAIAACRAAAAGVDIAGDGAARGAADVVRDWEGTARDEFDRAARRMGWDFGITAIACTNLANAIEAASDAARDEQSRRLAARAAELEIQGLERRRRLEGRPEVPQ